MNIRVQKYKQNRIAGMNILNAARAAGYSEKYALKKSYRLEQQVRVGMADAFERAGLTDKKIVEFAISGMNATKDGLPDWQTRHRFFETILKMTRKLEQPGVTIESGSNKPIIQIINYERSAQVEDTSTRVSAQRICVTDFEKPEEIQEHLLASQSAENNISVEQADK